MTKRTRKSPARRAMGHTTSTIQRWNRNSNPLFRIVISVNASQLGPKRAAAKRRSLIPRITYRNGTKRYGGKAKHHKAQRSPRYLRGVRKSQRRLQRKRKNLTIAKQALPAFFLFMAHYRSELQKQNPRQNAVQIVKKLGKMWHKQPEEDKEMYKKEAARLRNQKRRREMQKWSGKREKAERSPAGRRK